MYINNAFTQSSIYEIPIHCVSNYNSKNQSNFYPISPIYASPASINSDIVINDSLEFIQDYVFRLSHGTKATLLDNLVKIRVFRDTLEDNYFYQTDINLNGNVFDDPIRKFSLDDDRLCFKSGLIFSFKIIDKNLLSQGKLGGIAVKPGHIFVGKLNNLTDSLNFTIKDDLLGVTFFLDGMHIDGRRLRSVKLNQPFQWSEHNLIFTDFDISKRSIKLNILKDGEIMWGSDVGYFVDKGLLSEKLNQNLKRPLLLYFWGIWCKPCMDGMPITLDIYNMSDSLNIDMHFVSYSRVIKDKIESSIFLDNNSVDINDYSSYLELGNPLNDIDWISDLTIFTMLSILNFPTYVLIDTHGKIIYKSTKLSPENLKQILSTINR